MGVWAYDEEGWRREEEDVEVKWGRV